MSDEIRKDGIDNGPASGSASSAVTAEEEAVVLPQVGPAEGQPGGANGAESPEEPEVSAFRLLLTLGFAGGFAGALLVFVFQWSQPKIDAYDAQVLQEAVTEVLKGPDHYESIFIHEGELTTEVPAGVDTLGLEKVFLGYDEGGDPIGFAMEAADFGFQDLITLIFGYDPDAGQVIGMKVLRHAETPGLGNKIVDDLGFVGDFDGVSAPIEGVKPGRNTGDPNQVDMITGVTISSAAVIKIINDRIAEMENLLTNYDPAGGEGDR